MGELKRFLKACPYCGNANAPAIMTIADAECIDYPDAYDTSHYMALCDYNAGGCGAATRPGDTAEQAAEIWNMRAAGWRDYKTEQPQEPGEYLIFFYNEDGITGQEGRCQMDVWCYPENRFVMDNTWRITHWMPLPGQPVEDER